MPEPQRNRPFRAVFSAHPVAVVGVLSLVIASVLGGTVASAASAVTPTDPAPTSAATPSAPATATTPTAAATATGPSTSAPTASTPATSTPAAAGTPDAAGVTWLCNPAETPDPCAADLSTTTYSPTGAPTALEQPVVTTSSRPACFYVYPTVSLEEQLYSDLTIQPAEQQEALQQAGRWSQLCDVYAPMYRQLTIPALGTIGDAEVTSPTTLFAPGIADVGTAFQEFLTTVAANRPFIVIAHSQGAFIMRSVLAKQVDPVPAVRARMLSAILMGGNVLVKSGSVVGGDFQNIPGCTVRGQTGCVIAFSTFGYLPDATIWGVSTVPGESVLCTNPAVLDGSGRASPIVAAGELPGLPASTTTWLSFPNAFTAACQTTPSVLLIGSSAGSPVPNPTSVQSWGLHDLDANLFLGNLLLITRAQMAATGG